MTVEEAIRTGFRIIHRQWQLVAVQAGLMAANGAGLLIFVGIPLMVSVLIAGADAASVSNPEELVEAVLHPSLLVSKYLGVVLILGFCILLYVTAALTLWMFVFSGTFGMIGRTVSDPGTRLTPKGFLDEGRRMFFPFMWYSVAMGLIILAVVVVLGLCGAAVAVIVGFVRGHDSFLAAFAGIFSILFFAVMAVAVILMCLCLSSYGVATLFLRRRGAFAAIGEAVRFLWEDQRAFWLYVVLVAGYAGAAFLVVLVILPVQLIPVAGPLIAIPLQLLSSVFQSYLALVMGAVVFTYYYGTALAGPGVPDNALQDTSAPGSIHPGSTSPPRVYPPDPIPGGRGGRDEVQP